MAYLVANSYLGLVKEATRGTLPGSGTVGWIPVTTPQVTPMQTWLRDEALRGSGTLVYEQVAATRHDTLDFKSYLYADTFPHYLSAILGYEVTPVASSGASYTHVLGLLNSASTGSQPSSYSLLDFDGANYFQMLGAQAADLTITFGAEAAAEAAVKFIGNPYTSLTSAPTVFNTLSITSEKLVPSWNSTISVGGSGLTYIQSGELKFDRKTAPIFTMGTQAPKVNFAGPLEVTGKFTAVVDSNADPFSTGSSAYGLFRAGTPVATTITLTDPNDSNLNGSSVAVQHSISFTMSNVQYQNVKRVRGKEYTEVEVDFVANANTTDAISGYSPVKATVVNGTSTAY